MSTEQQEILFKIYRHDPETDGKPEMREYTLTIGVGENMMLLAALKLLKKQDASLTFRHSCGEGVCGSDAMNINGKNGLACVTSSG